MPSIASVCSGIALVRPGEADWEFKGQAFLPLPCWPSLIVGVFLLKIAAQLRHSGSAPELRFSQGTAIPLGPERVKSS